MDRKFETKAQENIGRTDTESLKKQKTTSASKKSKKFPPDKSTKQQHAVQEKTLQTNLPEAPQTPNLITADPKECVVCPNVVETITLPNEPVAKDTMQELAAETPESLLSPPPESSLFDAGSSIINSTGSTPILQLTRIPNHFNLKCKIFVKCEFVGPTGSIKDRVAESFIKSAEANGVLSPGIRKDTIIVPFSDTLAIALARRAIVGGYYVVGILPDSCPEAKVDIFHALGGETFRARTEDIPSLTEELLATIQNSFLFAEYENFDRVANFYEPLAQEIGESFNDQIHLLICNPESVGLAGAVKKRLNMQSPLRVGALIENSKVEDSKSFDYFSTILDKIYNVSEKEVFKMSRNLLRCESLLTSPSGGANVCAALKAINEFGLSESPEANVVIILEESVQNSYIDLFNDSWMLKNQVYTLPEMPAHHWWYDMTVGRLQLRTPNQIEKVLTVRFALDAMINEGSDELIVVDETNNNIVVGITLRSLLESGLRNGILSESGSLEQGSAISSDFTVLGIGATLGEVAELAKTAFYFIVVMKHHSAGNRSPGPGLEHMDVIVGFFTAVDVLKYTCGIEEHHKLNLKTDLNEPFISFDLAGVSS